jgi:hypothetical protein
MKISPETITILKNFASINKGILITPGTVLRTRTEAVFAEATVVEDFPTEVGIHDLNNFLSVVSLFKEPEFYFEQEYLYITESSGKADTKYAYAGAGMVQLPMRKKKIEVPAERIEFTLNEEQWSVLQKAVAVFNKPELKITSDGKVVRIGTENHKHQQGNIYSLVVDAEPNGVSCNMVFNMENLRLLKGSYKASVTPLFTMFENTSGLSLNYIVGPEPTTSTFGGE